MVSGPPGSLALVSGTEREKPGIQFSRHARCRLHRLQRCAVHDLSMTGRPPANLPGFSGLLAPFRR